MNHKKKILLFLLFITTFLIQIGFPQIPLDLSYFLLFFIIRHMGIVAVSSSLLLAPLAWLLYAESWKVSLILYLVLGYVIFRLKDIMNLGMGFEILICFCGCFVVEFARGILFLTGAFNLLYEIKCISLIFIRAVFISLSTTIFYWFAKGLLTSRAKILN